MHSRNQVDTIQYVRQYLRIAGLTILFGSVMVFLLIGKIIHGSLESLSPQSVALILWLLTVLAAATYGLTRITMQRAVNSIDEYRDKLDMLLYTSRDIHDVEWNEMFMEKILDAAYAMTGADLVALLLRKRHGIEFNTVRGSNPEMLRGRSYPVLSGIVEKALLSQRPVRTDNINEDDGYKKIACQLVQTDIQSALCIPLILNGRTIGVLALTKSVPGHFIKDDEELLQFFVNQSVISMKNAQHHELMKDLKDNLANFLVEAVERIWGKSGHAKKVAQYALKIGRTLALDQATLQRLYDASLLHDIGLLRADRTGHHAHPMHGHQLLRHIEFYSDISLVVLHHHERFDGSGYPARLKGEAIPLLSRIVSIAEAFDVMTNAKSFRNASGARPMSVPEALQELQRNAGTQFDPRLVALFADVLTQEEVSGPCALSPAEA